MPRGPGDEAIEILNRARRLALDDIVEIPVEGETGQPSGLQDGTRLIRQEGIVDGKSQLRAADQPWCRQRSEIGQADDLAMRISDFEKDAQVGRDVVMGKKITEHPVGRRQQRAVLCKDEAVTARARLREKIGREWWRERVRQEV